MNNTDIMEILTKLKKVPHKSYYIYCVGGFIVKIYTQRIQEHPSTECVDECLTKYNIVDVDLYELTRRDDPRFIEHTMVYLDKDFRFKNYTPIKYGKWAGYSTGLEMPLIYLCELIKYLHRLSSLSIFG